MKILKTIIIILFFIFIYSCQGAQDALQGKKRSQKSDEFLVEKKNPLIMPPDIKELPVPLGEEETQKENDSNEIQELLIEENKDNSTSSSNADENISIEQSVLEKIQN